MSIPGQHYLKPLSMDAIPTRWIFVAYRRGTFAFRPMLYRDGTWSDAKHLGERTDFWGCTSAFREGVGTIYCVGWSMYDALCSQSILEHFDRGDIALTVVKATKRTPEYIAAFLCGDPTIIEFRSGDNVVRCIDVNNLGIDLALRPVDPQQLLDHTVETVQGWVELIVHHQMGEFADTSAGQGFNRFRRRDMLEKSILVHNIPEVRRLERDSWHGARTEVKQLGLIATPTWNLDIKSMFASIACREKFPMRLVDCGGFSDHAAGTMDGETARLNRRIKPLSLDDARRHIRSGRHVIAEVRVRTPDPIYPVPYGDITVWPTGEFITVLPGPEFAYATVRDQIVDVRRYAVYDTAKIFEESSAWFFDARESLDLDGFGRYKAAFKQSQAAMYSNIGKRGHCWTNCQEKTGCFRDDPQSRWNQYIGTNPVTGEPCLMRHVNSICQYADDYGEPMNSAPMIGTTIFSYARLWMWRMLLKTTFDHVHAYDTDGLMVDDFGRRTLWGGDDPPPNKPGNLTLREYTEDLLICGIKNYRINGEWRQAGVAKDAVRDEFGNVVVVQHVPFLKSLRENRPFEHRYETFVRQACGAYRHGHVDADGRVTPFAFRVEVDAETGEEHNVKE
jgi:hypothetical protein